MTDETLPTEEAARSEDHRAGLLYTILIGAIVATLPCYCTGAMLIAFHQDSTPTPAPSALPEATATLWRPSPTATHTYAPTFTPTATNTPYIPSKTMRP